MKTLMKSLFVDQQPVREIEQRNGYVYQVKDGMVVCSTQVDVMSEAAHDSMRFGVLRSNSENVLRNVSSYRNSR